MNTSNHFQIVVKHLIEVSVFLSCFCQYHRQVKGNCADIEPSDIYGLVIFVSGSHAATLKPRGEKSPAPHRVNHSAILFVHFSHITFSRKREPVRVHGLCTALNTCFKYVLIDTALTMKVFVIEENQLREQNGFLIPMLTLSVLMYIKESDCRHLTERISCQPKGHCDKGVISTGTANRVQLHFNSLETLLKITAYLLHSPVPDFRSKGLLIADFHILSRILFVGLLSIGREDFINLRDGKAAILLRSSGKDNISHHVKGSIKGFRFVVPNITHFKTTCHNGSNIAETAVHGVQTGRLVMDIDIAVLASLQLVLGHKELAIQTFIEFVENQAAFCGNQGRVRIGIFLISDKTDRLAFLIYLVHKMNKIFLIVTIIPIGLCNSRLHIIQNFLYHIVHFCNGYGSKELVIDHSVDSCHNIRILAFSQLHYSPCSRFMNGVHNFLLIVIFQCSIFLNDFHTIPPFLPLKSAVHQSLFDW